MNCRICGSDNYQSVLDLGSIHTSGFSKEGAVLPKTPLHLVRCINCRLVQLKDSVNLDQLYKDFYWYRSSQNPLMIQALKDVVQSASQRVNLTPSDVVCDIGANDLTLLNFYPKDVIKVAFEPASNLAQYGKFADHYINDYFSLSKYTIGQKAKIVTSIAMFYDLEQPEAFVHDVSKILADDGIWIVQYTDLYETIRNNDFTNICQEHLCYYSTDILIRLLIKYGLEIFHIERNNVNGGSIRLYIHHKITKPIYNVYYPPKSDNYYLMLGQEMDFLAQYDFAFHRFRNNVQSIREKLHDFLSKHEGVYALGASTKSGTLIQYCKLDMIQAIGEISQEKIGLKNVTGIPIIHEDEVLALNPPLIIVLTWQLREFFKEKLSNYILNGGVVVFPLPFPEFMNADGVWII